MSALVLQSDFGQCDGAVAAMVGVALNVDPDLRIFDLTHEIPQYDIWEASYRLIQTLPYWAEGTVFVSVVDPGVGTDRLSVVAKTRTGQYVITPDNGTLTHVKRHVGIEAARVIDKGHHNPAGDVSYTFHGRDVYAYTGARLASGQIDFTEVGEEMAVEALVELPVVEARVEDGWAVGSIDVLDVRFGSLWSNIPRELFEGLGVKFGDRVEVSVNNDTREVYRNTMMYAKSFGDVHMGEALVYVNSLSTIAVAINQGSFARAYNIGTGAQWRIALRPAVLGR